MKKWLKKSLVTLITILTFGLVIPPQSIYNNDQVDKPDKDDFVESEPSKQQEIKQFQESTEQRLSARKQFLKRAIELGEAQSYTKFGEKIGPVIEQEFQQIILPNMEKAIQEVINQFPDEELVYLTVSEMPGKGVSEKIFHIYNEKTGKDIIRFHVRRERKPKEGYWFNFHYHTYHDSFQTHYDLGKIYWDKNTPPHWMS